MTRFFEQAQATIDRRVEDALVAERQKRLRTWPEYTRFMWETEDGWQSWLKSSSGQELKTKLTATLWQMLFCEAFQSLAERIQELEDRLPKDNK